MRGLNTAATLWCSAAVGLLAGEGFALYGLMAAALVLGTNTALRPIVRAINRQPIDLTEEEQHYLVSIDCRAAQASEIRSQLVEEVAGVPDLHFSQLDSAFIEDTGRVEVTATVTSQKRRELALETIVGRFSQADGVTRAAWRLNPKPSPERQGAALESPPRGLAKGRGGRDHPPFAFPRGRASRGGPRPKAVEFHRGGLFARKTARHGLPGANRAGKFGAGPTAVGGDSRSGKIGFAADGGAGMPSNVFIRRSASKLEPD